MLREGFRKQLRQEIEQWREESLISPEQYQALTDRYQLQLLATTPQLFTIVLYGLGAILLGLGVITFVAANWELWGKVEKFIILLLLLNSVNVLGFYCWQRLPNYKRLGPGLLLLGGLIFGAVLALVAQIFHISGSLYPLYFTWGIGVLAMAISLRLQSLGILSVILIGVGYGIFQGERDVAASGFFWLGEGMPIALIALLFVTYWLRSQAMMVITTLLWYAATFLELWKVYPVAAILIPILLLWGYNDGLGLDRLGRHLGDLRMQPFTRALAVVIVAGNFYLFSYKGVWEAWEMVKYWSWTIPSQPWYALQFYLFVVFACYGLLRWGISFAGRTDRPGQILIGLVIGLGILLTKKPGIIGIVCVNLFLALLSLGLIRLAVEKGARGKFWLGIVLLALQILSRMFEYDTELLLKALAFGVCGIAILGLGLWFERYLQKTGSLHISDR